MQNHAEADIEILNRSAVPFIIKITANHVYRTQTITQLGKHSPSERRSTARLLEKLAQDHGTFLPSHRWPDMHAVRISRTILFTQYVKVKRHICTRLKACLIVY